MYRITVWESTSINVHNFEYSMFFSEMPVYINIISVCSYVLYKDVVQLFEEKCLLSFHVMEQKAKFAPELSFLIPGLELKFRLDFKKKSST